MYLTHLAATPIAETERIEKMQVYDAFLWFMSDARELSRVPPTKEEMISRFRSWCDANVRGGFPPERTVEHLDTFFKWLEQARVVSSPP
jgi:hypothetical protein